MTEQTFSMLLNSKRKKLKSVYQRLCANLLIKNLIKTGNIENMKRYIILFLSLMSVCVLQAQRVRVAAPKQVTVGEEFQVEYVVYTQECS